MTEAAAVQMVSSLVNAVSYDFGVEGSFGHAWFMTCLFAGIQVGTIVAGPLCDAIGRRWPVLFSYFGMIIVAIVCYFLVLDAESLYVCLIFYGCFAGVCIPAALINLSEVMPSKLRGLGAVAMAISFTAGNLWASLGCWIYMPMLED